MSSMHMSLKYIINMLLHAHKALAIIVNWIIEQLVVSNNITIIMLHISATLWGKPHSIGGFPSQGASTVESIFMSWSQHVPMTTALSSCHMIWLHLQGLALCYISDTAYDKMLPLQLQHLCSYTPLTLWPLSDFIWCQWTLWTLVQAVAWAPIQYKDVVLPV